MIPGDRLFSPINDLLIILSAISHATSVMVGGSIHKEQNPSMRVGARQFEYSFVIPLRGPLEHAIVGKIPESIEIGTTTESAPLIDAKLSTRGLDGVMTHVISPIFITFFERYNDWLNDNYGEATNWHPTLNFCRVIRNAAAHGSIHFRNPRAPSVSWRGLTYGPEQNGRQIIGTDIRFGDIIGLMFEANNELNAINAPIL